MRTILIATAVLGLLTPGVHAQDKPPTPDELAKDPALFLGEARKRLSSTGADSGWPPAVGYHEGC